jgi:hypothetical protein
MSCRNIQSIVQKVTIWPASLHWPPLLIEHWTHQYKNSPASTPQSYSSPRGILENSDNQSTIVSSSDDDEISDDDCFSTISIGEDSVAADDAHKGSGLTRVEGSEGIELGLEGSGEGCERVEHEPTESIFSA